MSRIPTVIAMAAGTAIVAARPSVGWRGDGTGRSPDTRAPYGPTKPARMVAVRILTRLLLACAWWSASALRASEVMVEAEGFVERGGWVVDPQFMDQMGSPYLLYTCA